jgi:superfamily II DNA or RNA helicase
VQATLNGLFTGAGKTVIFCLLAARIAGRTLIICPLRELVWQTIDKVQQVTNLYQKVWHVTDKSPLVLALLIILPIWEQWILNSLSI